MSDWPSFDQLKASEGIALLPTDWILIDQQRIQQFADCTDDHQFIHVDPERMRDSLWGTTIAHGFLALSLAAGHRPADWPQEMDAETYLNYGLDRVRFIRPVPVNSKVRFHTQIVSVTEKSPGRALIKVEKTLVVQGISEPAMVAELLLMLISNARYDRGAIGDYP